MPRVVLVTGVSRELGSRVAARLAAGTEVEHLVGVDAVPPRGDVLHRLGRTEFVRADIRSPLIAKVIASAGVDTVVHLNVLSAPGGSGGRTAMKEMNVLGTLQLLAACQKAPSISRLVLKSTTAVYGSSAKDPALFAEDMEPRETPRSGYAKDAVEVEGYVRGLARRRPDVAVTVLRLANVLAPWLDTPMARYFTLPTVPTVLGYDPRLQFLHADDAIDVLHRVSVGDAHGVYNVAGSGVLLLSQAVRRAGRLPVPVPQPLASSLGALVRRAGTVDFSPEQLRLLAYGRVVDTSAAAAELGFVPRYSTAEAFDDFVRGRDLSAGLVQDVAAGAERAVLDLIAARRTVDA